MNSIITTYPLELLSIDFLSIEVNGQKQNILVMMDHFTKFGQAICTKDQTAKTVARTLWKEFFLIYGFPSRILSDQGRDFESNLVKELCKVAGIEKCRTTPYHPAGNPVERWNRTLLGMLRSLEDTQKLDLKKVLPEVVHAYNCCIHQSTGHSPYFLFFGRHPRLPIDLAFGIDLGSKKQATPSHYIRDLKRRLASAYQKASDVMEKSRLKNKSRYDVSARAAELDVGDRVLVRKLGPRLDSKLSDRWENAVYVVLHRRAGLPVYTVQDEACTGPKRTLHRNYLLPIGMIDSPSEDNQRKVPVTCPSKPKPRQIRKKPVVDPVVGEEDEFEGCTIEIPPPVHPRSSLSVDAAEFVPRVGDNQFSPVSGEALTEHTDEGEEDLVEEEYPEQSRVPSPIEDKSLRQDSSPAESVRSVGMSETEDDEFSSSENSETDEETELKCKEGPVPVPRRSLRTKHPVDRLNLMHAVQTPEVHLPDLVGRAQNYLCMLAGSQLDPERVNAIEQVLKVLMSL